MGRQLVAIFALLTASGCALGERDELPPITWEGVHMRYGADDGALELCGGTLLALDEHAGALKAEFGAPADLVIDYYAVTDTDVDFWFCPDGVPACAGDSVVLATAQADEHEVVHAVAQGAGFGGAHPLLAEGVAEAYSLHTYGALPEITIDEMLQRVEDGEGLGADGYVKAGHFLAWLVDEYGIDEVVTVSVATHQDDLGRASVDQAFADVLSEQLDDVIARYEVEAPACEYQKHRNGLVDCEAVDFALERDLESLPYVGNAELDWSAACADEATIGPRQNRRWRRWTFDIPEEAGNNASVFLWVEADEVPAGDGWHVASCGDCEGEVDEWAPFIGDGGSHWLSGFEPGRYVLTAYVDDGEALGLPGRVSVQAG